MTAQEGPTTSPRGGPEGDYEPKARPFRPKRPPGGPKRPPRNLKGPPGGPPSGPRRPPSGPKEAPRGPACSSPSLPLASPVSSICGGALRHPMGHFWALLETSGGLGSHPKRKGEKTQHAYFPFVSEMCSPLGGLPWEAPCALGVVLGQKWGLLEHLGNHLEAS